MTKRLTHKGFKTLLALLLAVMFAMALAFVSACKNGDDSSSSSSSDSSSSTSTSTTVDAHKLLNGSFEYYAEGDVTFPYKTSIRWTNSYGYLVNSADKAPSSSATSGIISTGDAAYASLLETKVGSKTLNEFLTDEGNTFNPHSPYYYGYTELDNDIPEGSEGDRVLMIHNRITGKDKQGTAQYFYTSGSTLSLAAGEYGKLSVWVNTYGLTTEMDTNEFGAYVKVTDNVGSTAASPFMVKNINTEGKWANVTVYIKGAEFASSTYSVYLGLGIGDEHISSEYAEGFAFFDDVTFEVLSKAEYDAQSQNVSASNTKEVFTVSGGNSELAEGDLEVSLVGTNYETNVKDDKTSFSAFEYILSQEIELTSETPSDEKTFNESAFSDATHKEAAQTVSVGADTVANITITDKDDKAFLGKDSDDNYVPLFDDTAEFVYFDYYAESSSYTVKAFEKTLSEGYYLLTFWAKADVKDILRSATGLTVKVVDMGDKDMTIPEKAYSETNVISSVIETTAENNGWKQYSVVISNTAKGIDTDTGLETDEVPDRTFKVVITFGPTDPLINDKNMFPQNYALVGDFRSAKITESTNSLLSVSNSVSLKAEILNYKSENTDTYAFNGRKSEIENGILSQPLSTLTIYDTNKENTGIFNTEYLTSLKDGKGNSVDVTKLDADEGNKHLQALAIGDATGYYTSKYTVSAGGTAKVTVKLATLGGATATVSVLDRSNLTETGYGVLTLSKDNFKTVNFLGASEEFTGASYSYTLEDDGDAQPNWKTVTFYIAAGTEDIDFGVDVWNGTRGGKEEVTGVVVVNSIDVYTSDGTSYKDLIDDAELNGKKYTGYTFTYKTIDYNEDATDEVVSYSVTENEGFYFKPDDDYTLYLNFLPTNYVESNLVKVETEDSSEETSSSSASADSDNLPTEVRWLAISSIVIAAVLILVLIIIVIRYFVRKAKAKREKTSSYYEYDLGARDRAHAKTIAKKAKLAAETVETKEEEPEEEEYDYDAAEAVEETPEEEETETTETETEEAADEAVEETAEETPAETASEKVTEEEKKEE